MNVPAGASTCLAAVMFFGMNATFCRSDDPPSHKRSRLVTLVLPTDKELASREPARIEFLMLIHSGKAAKQANKRGGVASAANIAQFLGKATTLKSLWLSPDYLSAEVVEAIRGNQSLKLLVVTDPSGGQDLIDKLATSNSVDRLILFTNEVPEQLSGKHGERLVVEIETHRDNQYLDSNGCPKTAFLEDHFGVKF